MKHYHIIQACTFLVLLFLSPSLTAQTGREYTYDPAGNRIQRKVLFLVQRTSENAENQEVTSLTDSKGDYSFTLFPNPTTGEVEIQADVAFLEHGQPALYVFDMTGKQLIQQPFASQRQIVDLSAQIPGSYIVKVISGSYLVEWKVIKE